MSEELPIRRPWLVYTALRFLVFIGSVGLLLIVGLNGFLLLVAALLLSMVVSLVVLRPQRAAVVSAQIARRERRSAEREALRAPLEDS